MRVKGILIVQRRQCFWSRLPLFVFLRYLSTAASSPLRRNVLIGGRRWHKGSRLLLRCFEWLVDHCMSSFAVHLHLLNAKRWCGTCWNFLNPRIIQFPERSPDSLGCWWLRATFVTEIWPTSCWIVFFVFLLNFFKSFAKKNLAKTLQTLSTATCRPLCKWSSPSVQSSHSGNVISDCRLSTSFKMAIL